MLTRFSPGLEVEIRLEGAKLIGLSPFNRPAEASLAWDRMLPKPLRKRGSRRLRKTQLEQLARGWT